LSTSKAQKIAAITDTSYSHTEGYGWTDGRMDGWMEGRKEGRKKERKKRLKERKIERERDPAV
jgi:hypothetical protein